MASVAREDVAEEAIPPVKPEWATERYDALIREALGEDALQHNTPIAGDLTGTELLRAYTVGRVSRDLDQRERTLQAQGKAWFSIAGAGKEVIGWAFARYLTRHDAKLPYYRDRTLMLCSGVTPEEMLLATVGAGTDTASGGRQMPSHWSHRDLGVISQSSAVGSQAIPATGVAEGIVLGTKLGIPLNEPWQADSVVLVTLGDGTTAEGEVEEGIREAVRTHAPVIFLIEDDKYAISVPVSWSAPGGDIAGLYRHYEEHGMLVMQCDGTDPVDSDATALRAVEYTRARKGPVVVHALVTRPMSHSSTDTQDQYRTPEELAEEAARDPVLRLSHLLRNAGILDDERQSQIDEAVTTLVRDAASQATEAPRPNAATITDHVTACDLQERKPEPQPEQGEPVELRYALNRALHKAMEENPRIVVFGEDVADAP